MDKISILAKSLQVGDYVITRPVDDPSFTSSYIEQIVSVGINMSDRTVDIRTSLAGQIRSAMGMPMDMEVEIYRQE